jgi:hypothetical protein
LTAWCSMSDLRIKTCTECKRTLISIDYYGESLHGCVPCNRWQSAGSDLWEELPEEDLHALARMVPALS